MTLLSNDISFAIANPDDRSRAIDLRQSIFIKKYGHIGTSYLDSNSNHLVAKNGAGEVVAALRIMGPDQRPFDFEEMIDVRRLMEGRRPAHVGGLCVRPDLRNIARFGFVSIGLFKFAFNFARQRSFTDLIVDAQIRHRTFYESCFFETVVDEFQHTVWGPMSLMRLDIQTAGNSLKPRSFERFLGADFPNLGIK